jgi:hypothetical protein
VGMSELVDVVVVVCFGVYIIGMRWDRSAPKA